MANDQSFILSQITGSAARSVDNTQDILLDISRNVEVIARNSANDSQGSSRSAINDQVNEYQRRNTGRSTNTSSSTNMREDSVGRREQQNSNTRRRTGINGFLDGIEDGIFGDFKNSLSNSMGTFADGLASQLGVTREELSHQLGQTISNAARNSLNSTTMGQHITGAFGDLGSSITSLTNIGMNAATDALAAMQGGGTLQAGISAFTSSLSASSGAISGALGTATTAIASIGPQILIAGAALIALDFAFGQLQKAGEALKEGFEALGEGISGAVNRANTMNREWVELGEQRLAEDVKTLVTEPFNNLRDATDDLCSAWQQTVATINATQGYTKDSLQTLISNYASRLREEGLSSVVSSADITTNLQKVLESGLSGAAAEEFAYMATVLQNAVPTQDFFSYAPTYAAIAANAVKDGLSEIDALSLANQEMEQFASNVLYASRQLAGGFSTGLQNTADLFNDAYKIAQSAKTGDASNISGVLTAVAGVIGAIAPDLSDGLVQSVVDAAIGGNSETNVALRSLAGVNASNSEFLKALATQPQQIFTELFNNLATMQASSADNFMEVAEGLAGVFGVSMDSLARVDFVYLADAISQMNVNSNTLEENMSLLADGQTKTTTEQLKIAEINKLMIEEGLAYVLDNEAGRAIQEHLWEEQMLAEIKETEFSVSLQGSAATFLERISEAVKAIGNILNPFAALANAVGNIALTVVEGYANDADIRQMLELGRVGESNTALLRQLLTRGTKQNVTESLVSQMGGISFSSGVGALIDSRNILGQFGFYHGGSAIDAIVNLHDSAKMIYEAGRRLTSSNRVDSSYQWGTVSKSLNTLIQSSAKNNAYYTQAIDTSVATQIEEKSQASFQSFMDSMGEYFANLKEGEESSYDKWSSAAATRFGIKNIAESAQKYGITEDTIKGKFQEYQSKQAAQKAIDRQKEESDFWDISKEYFKNTAPSFHEKLLTTISNFYKDYKSFYNDWIEYYVKHTAYTAATVDISNVEQIVNADKTATGDAINALADALLSNAVDLRDPQVQTNVLLSQMLVTLNAILQQETRTNNSVLPTSLSALGLGLVSNT